MLEKIQSNILPIGYLNKQMGDGLIIFYGATFTRDFGCFRGGDYFLRLTIDFNSCKIIAGEIEQDFKVFPCYCNNTL
jgi:hypothetical protein